MKKGEKMKLNDLINEVNAENAPRIFEKGPTFVMEKIDSAAEWICSDWPEGSGFQTSDRNAVFRDALRDVIGAKNAEMFFKGQIVLDPAELSLFKTGVNNAISNHLS